MIYYLGSWLKIGRVSKVTYIKTILSQSITNLKYM